MFTVKGINRLKILQDAIDRNLHPGQAAEMLGITPRHCRRLLLAFNIYLYRAYNLLGHIALTIMTEGGKQPPA
ncbi:hypothetical protein C6J62_01505 [Salmonella enterica subsp. enterica serovar Typhimurium]|nr:hypothetical protein [Salmonella enterica subsp. enterica serovar 4,[5],12:i:-]EEC2555374.1 hypothetical protein [Salmonella enterica subsp. enterica serovar Typhimurium]